jgi:AraC-like DNA-binding protein
VNSFRKKGANVLSDHLLNKLQQLQQRESDVGSSLFVPHPAGIVFGSAWETQTVDRHYSWDGLKRGGDPSHPALLFQYTLAGWGYFRQEKKLYTMVPHSAFIAIIPSNHHYYLPAESPHWTFFWFILRHPYVVNRIAEQAKGSGAVLKLNDESLLVKRSLDILELISASPDADPFLEEEALFRFLIAYERALFHLNHPPSEREHLLQSTRSSVLHALPRLIDVAQLAEHHHMSRSAFSHAFKAITGQSPAHYMTRVRLEEATNSLLSTRQSLEEIAAQTGFANATHFCKVFRRFFQLSPGEFRRQMNFTREQKQG